MPFHTQERNQGLRLVLSQYFEAWWHQSKGLLVELVLGTAKTLILRTTDWITNQDQLLMGHLFGRYSNKT